MQEGNKKFIKILKDDWKDAPIEIEIVVAGKQKNLGKMADSITNIFRFIFSNPQGFMQIMQMPGMAKSFNQIMEYSGLNSMDFSGMEKIQQEQQMQQQNMAQGQAPQLAVNNQ